MEEEKRAAAIKIQLALVKSIGLTEDEMKWLNEFYDPDIIEEIRIAIKDGMKVSAVMDAFAPDMSREQARAVRLAFYQTDSKETESQKDLSVIINYMDEMENTLVNSLQRLIEERLNSLIIRMDKFHEGLNTQLQEIRVALQERDKNQEDLTNKHDSKKKLFAKKQPQDVLVQLVEKGRFNPEQLEEITFAINEGLSSEIILAIAKPELSPEAMHQLRLFYIAKNMASVGASSGKEDKREQNSTARVRESEVVNDYEEESEDYG